MTTKLSAKLVISAALAASGLALSATASPAAAEPQASSTDFKVRFSYDKSDLDTREGAQKLIRQMERRVRSECGANERPLTQNRREIEACVQTTMRTTVAKIGSPTLTATYDSQTAG